MKKILLIGISSVFLLRAGAQGSLVVRPGTHFITSGTINVTLTNTGLTNDGTLQQQGGGGTSALIFEGANDASVSGSGSTLFSRMMVVKETGTLSLNQDITISAELVFASGLLNLGNNIVALSPGALIWGESESSHTVATGSGYIETSANLNAPSAVNMGNLGAVITSSANLGTTVIRRGNFARTIGTGSSIRRYYVISPANNTGLDATLRFTYLTAELNGLDAGTLSLQKSADGVTWTNEGFSARGTAPAYVEKTGISGFSSWTLATAGNTLPVAFSGFAAVCSDDGVLFTWKTAREFQSGRFEVERSSDARNWQVAGTVAAAGNSAVGQSYQYKDRSGTGNEYYRVVEYGLDGRKTISSVVKSSCASERSSLQVYPNPVQDLALLNFVAARNERVTCTVVDQGGRTLSRKEVDVTQGSNAIPVNTAGLPSGVYLLNVHTGSGNWQLKFMKR